MTLSEDFENAGRLFFRLDDDSCRALCKDYIPYLDRSHTPTYRKWLAEREETGITQARFAQKHGINFGSQVRNEIEAARIENENRLQAAFDEFVHWHKDEIYKAQCDAILMMNKQDDEQDAKNKRDEELANSAARQKWQDSIRQYLDGQEVAMNTGYKGAEGKINRLLAIGYKVKCASGNMVFLYYDGGEKPCAEDIESIFPFKFEYKPKNLSRLYGIVLPKRICGVQIPHDLHLKGYEYPEYKHRCSVLTMTKGVERQ